MPKPLTNIEFAEKARKIHDNKYDYSLVNYINAYTKVKIICPLHGIFEQTPSVHLRDKCKCPQCAILERNLTKTTEQFINEAKQIYSKYDYSLVNYLGSHIKVKIICKLHGIFEILPYALLQKQGCRKCGYINRKIPHKKTTEQFIEIAQKKWNYNYSKTIYKNKYTKIKFDCPLHGEIEQLPYLHLKHGCCFCNGRGISKHTKTSFIKLANVVHKNKYNYDKVDFVRMSDKIIITCPKHGDFFQRAGNHIHLENGCPKCHYPFSKAEKEIFNFIKLHYSGEILENDRIELGGKEIDIYLPDLKIGFEYNGNFHHTEIIRGKKCHYIKWKLAHDKGIRLFQFQSNEWKDSKDVIKSKILNFLGKNERIFARKTKIIELSRDEAETFLIKNHLQGGGSSFRFRYGLTYNGELVSCMIFGKSRLNRNFDWELIRFCNKNYISVVGGASKLLAHFRKNHSGSIVTYADKRYSNGDLYKKLGFVLEKENPPGFVYFNINNNQLYNRMSFQKKNLTKMPYYDDNLAEWEIMLLNDYHRIFDAGCYRFALR